MSEVTVSNHYVDSLVDYALDVKPYHTKLSEVVEEYQFDDSFSVSVGERMDTLAVMGPDYLKNSSNPLLNVWDSAPIRPDSTLNAERVFQSDGIRKTYNVPALLYYKSGDLSGNIFTTTVAATGTDVPGLSYGVFNQRKFFGVESVKVNNALKTLNTDYYVSRGAFSFDISGAAQTWIQHNLVGLPQYTANSGTYSFTQAIRNYGMIDISDISVSQSAANYEEWTLTWDTSITAFHVVGSTSGAIGTAAIGLFTNPKISFTVKEAPGEDPGLYEIPNGTIVKLTPKNKITVHPSAPTETWTLINVGTKYLVYGSVSGWQATATVDQWYDNGKIAFKIPRLYAFVYVNGILFEESPLIQSGNSVSVDVTNLEALPSVYRVVMRDNPPNTATGVSSASVFNNLTGYKRGIELGTPWSDEWITLSIAGTFSPGDTIDIFLAPGKTTATAVGYDQFLYEYARYGAGYAERFVPDGPLQDYLPLYHSQDAIVIPSATIGQTIKITKAQHEFMRMRLGSGEDLDGSLGAEDGWIPLDYRPDDSPPNYISGFDVYLASNPNMKVFTISQPEGGGGRPGLATLTFDNTFFNDYIGYLTNITFQFRQADDYGQSVGVNMFEALVIQVNELATASEWWIDDSSTTGAARLAIAPSDGTVLVGFNSNRLSTIQDLGTTRSFKFAGSNSGSGSINKLDYPVVIGSNALWAPQNFNSATQGLIFWTGLDGTAGNSILYNAPAGQTFIQYDFATDGTNAWIGGALTTTATGHTVAVVMKVNGTTGAIIWQKQLTDGPTTGSFTITLKTTSTGEAYAGVSGTDGGKFYVVKLDTNGAQLWQRLLTGIAADIFYDSAVLSNGNIAYLSLDSGIEKIAYLVVLNSSTGATVFGRKLGSSDFPVRVLGGVTGDALGNVYISITNTNRTRMMWYGFDSTGTLLRKREFVSGDGMQSPALGAIASKGTDLYFVGLPGLGGSAVFKVPADGTHTGTYTLTNGSALLYDDLNTSGYDPVDLGATVGNSASSAVTISNSTFTTSVGDIITIDDGSSWTNQPI
jgi:hypothetical protein